MANKLRGPSASVSQEEAKRICHKKKKKKRYKKKLLYFVRMWDRKLSLNGLGGSRGVKKGGRVL